MNYFLGKHSFTVNFVFDREELDPKSTEIQRFRNDASTCCHVCRVNSTGHWENPWGVLRRAESSAAAEPSQGLRWPQCCLPALCAP